MIMNKAARLKRRANLLYQLRKQGIECNTGFRLIFIPYMSDPYRYPQVRKLCREYHFNIQYIIV